jgi:hypothetical protein
MWQATHERHYPNLTREAVFALWADVNDWSAWDRDIEYARLDGPFANGAKFELKPKGGPLVRLSFVRVDEPNGYTDLLRLPLACMYGIHDVVQSAGGVTLRISIRIEGPLGWLWRRLVAQKIADEAPAQMDALACHAASRLGRAA